MKGKTTCVTCWWERGISGIAKCVPVSYLLYCMNHVKCNRRGRNSSAGLWRADGERLDHTDFETAVQNGWVGPYQVGKCGENYRS